MKVDRIKTSDFYHDFIKKQKLHEISSYDGRLDEYFKDKIKVGWLLTPDPQIPQIRDIIKTIDEKIVANYPGLSIGRSMTQVAGISYDSRLELQPEEKKVLEDQISIFNSIGRDLPIENFEIYQFCQNSLREL